MSVLLGERTWRPRWRRGSLEVGTHLFYISTEQDERAMLPTQLEKQKVRLLGHFLKLTVDTQIRV